MIGRVKGDGGVQARVDAGVGAALDPLGEASLMRDIRAISTKRDFGTPEGARSARALANTMKTIGLAPAGDEGYLQPFEAERRP